MKKPPVRGLPATLEDTDRGIRALARLNPVSLAYGARRSARARHDAERTGATLWGLTSSAVPVGMLAISRVDANAAAQNPQRGRGSLRCGIRRVLYGFAAFILFVALTSLFNGQTPRTQPRHRLVPVCSSCLACRSCCLAPQSPDGSRWRSAKPASCLSLLRHIWFFFVRGATSPSGCIFHSIDGMSSGTKPCCGSSF